MIKTERARSNLMLILIFFLTQIVTLNLVPLTWFPPTNRAQVAAAAAAAADSLWMEVRVENCVT